MSEARWLMSGEDQGAWKKTLDLNPRIWVQVIVRPLTSVTWVRALPS